MQKSTPAWKKYTTAGCVVVANMSYVLFIVFCYKTNMYVYVLFVNGIVTGTGQDDQCIYIWLLRGALPYRFLSSFLRYLISISWHFKVIIGKRFHPFISNRFGNWWKSRSKISSGAVGKSFKLATPDSASGMIFKFCLEMMCTKRCLKFSLFPEYAWKTYSTNNFSYLAGSEDGQSWGTSSDYVNDSQQSFIMILKNKTTNLRF